MDYTSEADLERVATVLDGFAHKTRVALLLGLYHGKDRDEIADALDMTRGGIHKNLERMRKADLVYRPEDTEYALTPLGVYWARLLDQEADDILAVLETLHEVEQPVRDEVEATKQSIDEKEEDGFSFQIDENTWERSIHTEKWNRAKDTISDILGLDAEENNAPD